MATTYTHAQIGIVDASGNVNVIYPITTGADVSIDRKSNANLPTTATTAQKLANALGALAFKNIADIISTDGNSTSTTKTWSSSVINSKLSELSSNTDTVREYADTLHIDSKYRNLNILRKYFTTNQSRAVLFTLPNGLFHNSGFYPLFIVIGWDLLMVNTCPMNISISNEFTNIGITTFKVNTSSSINYTIKHRKKSETEYQIYIGFDIMGAGEIYIFPFRYYEGYDNSFITEYTE